MREQHVTYVLIILFSLPSRLIIPDSSLWSMNAIYMSYDTSRKNNTKYQFDVEDLIKSVYNLKI